jgi:hypothetical protein
MLRNHATFSIGSLGSVVNSFVTTIAVLMMSGGYFTAIGRIAFA